MKFIKNKLIIFFLLRAVVSFAQKEEHDVVNDFLETEVSKMAYDSIYVIEKPLSKNESIKLYESCFSERLFDNKQRKKTLVVPQIINWPFNQNEIDLLKKKIKKEDKKWIRSDFENKKFIIYPEELIRSRDCVISHTSANKYIFNLSRPILNGKKDFAIFQFYPSFLIGGASSDLGGLILMKKENNKWTQVAVIQYAVYN